MRIVLKMIGALGVLLGSFFGTLAALDYFSAPSVRIIRLMKVQEATYGGNCGRRVGAGNATQFLSKACDGRPSCTVVVSVQELGDPAQGCSKDFFARYACDGLPNRQKYLKGETNGLPFSLDCQEPQ